MSDSQTKHRLGRFVDTIVASETVRAFVPAIAAPPDLHQELTVQSPPV